MNIDDFRYMWRGKQLQSLDDQQSNLLLRTQLNGQHQLVDKQKLKI